MTPIEEVIQRFMEPDKHGDKGTPARTVCLGDTFTRPVQRTLDALWKFAEGTAIASRDSMDHYNSAVDRVRELEKEVHGLSLGHQAIRAAIGGRYPELRLDAAVEQVLIDLKDIIREAAQHDSWRCREYQECHCGLDEMTDLAGIPRIPYPPK